MGVKMNLCARTKQRASFSRVGRGLLRLLVLASVLLAGFSLPAPAAAAHSLADSSPPPMPASFYGEIHMDPGPQPGASIEARVAGVTGPIATTTVVLDGATLVYALDVPGDISGTPEIEGAVEGELVTFSIGGVSGGAAPWHTGSHTQFDLTTPAAPPPLPASFYGEIHISPNPPQPGALIEARISGVTSPIASIAIALDGATLVYALDVPGDNTSTPEIEGAAEGQLVTFSIAGTDLGTAEWHTGTHTRLDFTSATEPPPVPHTFWGRIHFFPTPPALGTPIEARIPSLGQPIADTVVVQDGVNLAYSMIVPGDVLSTPGREGAVEGELVTFWMGGKAVASAPWHSGEITQLDFNFFEIVLNPGWNLVSFNLHPSTTAISQVLSSVFGSYDQVYVWNAAVSQKNWLIYSPYVPDFVNTLSALDERNGFWIHITAGAPVTLSLTGTAPTSTTINLYTTAGGWNLVGFPAASAKALPGAVPAPVNQVFAYHNGDAIPWKNFDRNAPSFINSLSSLTPGWGYWMYTNAAASWVVTYP